MTYTTSVAETAVSEVRHFLQSTWPEKTVAIHSVEEDPAYQQHDVDLLWTVVGANGRLRVIPIEVKGDRYHRTGNFFFETVSNESKGTPGCFLYTKAVWLFYLFVEIVRLYCLPMATVEPWFLHHLDDFPEKRTSTPTKSGQPYVTVGRLVPIETAVTALPEILVYQKEAAQWTQILRDEE